MPRRTLDPVTLAILASHAYDCDAIGERFDVEFLQAWLDLDFTPRLITVASEDIRATVVDAGDDTIVVFRGTEPRVAKSVRRNFRSRMSTEDFYRVHEGFQTGLNLIAAELQRVILSLPQPRRLTLTGHSQGGALATICAVRWFNSALDFRGTPISDSLYPYALTTFGSPRVGCRKFAGVLRTLQAAGVTVSRYTASCDVVPFIPPVLWGYEHGVPESYLSRRSDLHHDPSTLWRLWDTFCDRIRTRTLFARDSLDGHRVGNYLRKLERSARCRK